MKNKELQEQLSEERPRAYYTMTSTENELEQPMHFAAAPTASRKTWSRVISVFLWALVLTAVAYLLADKFSA